MEQTKKSVKWLRIKKIGAFIQATCICLTTALLFVSFCSKGFLIGSNSMSPTLEEGDFVLLWTLTPPEKLEEGDIAGYISNTGNTVIHRTVQPYLDEETDRVGWCMQGDANEGLDVQTLTVNNMVGKMFMRFPNASSKGFKMILTLIYGIPVLLVCLAGLVRTYADMKLSDNSKRVAGKDK